MADTDSVDVLPWSREITAASALLAVVTHYTALPIVGAPTVELSTVAGLGVLYLLYRWGQERDPPNGGDPGDGRKRRAVKSRNGGDV